ncbi:MAG: 23S rRNA pseudouridine2605 synthase, partial [Saprospiraceae bacterium]
MSKDKNPPDQKASEEGMRLNKYVAHCGICSRRKAAEYVMQGHINVNDQLIKEPGHRVLEGDKVYFKGELIEPEVKV